MFSKTVCYCIPADAGPAGKGDVPSTGAAGWRAQGPYRLLGGNKWGRRPAGAGPALTSPATGLGAKREPTQAKQNRPLGWAWSSGSESPRSRGSRRGASVHRDQRGRSCFPENPRKERGCACAGWGMPVPQGRTGKSVCVAALRAVGGVVEGKEAARGSPVSHSEGATSPAKATASQRQVTGGNQVSVFPLHPLAGALLRPLGATLTRHDLQERLSSPQGCLSPTCPREEGVSGRQVCLEAGVQHSEADWTPKGPPATTGSPHT